MRHRVFRAQPCNNGDVNSEAKVVGGSYEQRSETAPTATTTYTLESTNEYGRATAKVTITVH